MNLAKIAASALIISGLTVGGLEVEKADQISKIKAKDGVNVSMVVAAMKVSDTHKKNVHTALIDEFDKDKYVDRDNYLLHQNMFDQHFKDLEKDGKLPTWSLEPGKFTNDELIKKVHESLLSNQK